PQSTRNLKSRIINCAVLLTLLLLGCGAQTSSPSPGRVTSSSEPKPSRMRAALGEDVVTFSSRFTNTRNRLDAVINAFLTQTDDRWVLFPALVEKLPVQDDGSWVVNPDGTMVMS